jgi:ubiquinol-cytochrome c reductase cytochrome c1 subunit
MRTESILSALLRKKALLPAWALLLAGSLLGAGARAAEESAASWTQWHAATSVADLTSVQHGARNFVNYCLGCHSLQYQRWSRLGDDLRIPPSVLEHSLLPAGDKPADYILTSMPAGDAETWFGKVPPDLTLMVRARGRDYIYQFLKTFYVDPTRPTGANNLRLPGTAMPAVLSGLQGPQRAVFKNVEIPGSTTGETEAVYDHLEPLAPGQMTPEEYDIFVRDTVNFLDYVSEPAQMQRRSVGIWVVLFLLVFTWFAWLMKKEYWKDVH